MQKTQWMERFTNLTNGTLIASAFFLPLSTTITDILFPISAILSLFSDHWKEKWRSIVTHPISFFLILYALLYVVASFYSIAPYQDILHRLSKVCTILFGVILIGFSCKPIWRQRALNAFLIAMIITLFFSYIKYFLDPAFLHSRFDQSSVFKDHIIQNFLIVFAAFIFAYRFEKRFRFRWIYALLVIASVFNALFISQGRSGYFIFSALLLYAGIHYFGWRGLWSALIITLTLNGAAYYFSNPFNSRVTQIVSDVKYYQQGQGETSVGIRIQSIKNAYFLLKEKPWFGYGTGSFAAAYASLPEERTKQTGLIPISYNAFLNVGVELGIIGIVIILFNFFLQWQYSAQLPDEYGHLIKMLLVSMIVGCLGNSWLTDTTEMHLYVLLLALSFSEKMKLFPLPKKYYVPSFKLE